MPQLSKQAKITSDLSKELNQALPSLLEKALGQRLHVKVKSGNVRHEQLIPEGEQVQISFVLTYFPKKEKPDGDKPT